MNKNYFLDSKKYALLGILSPLLFWVLYLTMSTLRHDFCHFTKAVSELGSWDAPNKWIWNVFSYILPGCLIAIYAFGLNQSISSGSGKKVAFIGIFLSGLFMALAGFFPGDFEKRTSISMLIHTIGSFGSYLAFLIGAFFYPSMMRRNSYWSSSVIPTLVFTWLTIVFGAWPYFFPESPALGQKIVFLFFFSWVFFTALRLYREPSV